MSVRRAQAEIDSAEFSEWRAFYQRVESFGEYRADVRNAIVANTIAACHGAKTQLDDFMPYVDREKLKQSEEDKAAAGRIAATALGVVYRQNK